MQYLNSELAKNINLHKVSFGQNAHNKFYKQDYYISKCHFQFPKEIGTVINTELINQKIIYLDYFKNYLEKAIVNLMKERCYSLFLTTNNSKIKMIFVKKLTANSNRVLMVIKVIYLRKSISSLKMYFLPENPFKETPPSLSLKIMQEKNSIKKFYDLIDLSYYIYIQIMGSIYKFLCQVKSEIKMVTFVWMKLEIPLKFICLSQN